MTEVEEKSIKIVVVPKEDGCNIGIQIRNLAPFEIIGLLEQAILETKISYGKNRERARIETPITEESQPQPQVDAE